MLQRRSAKKRAKLGLSLPLAANRYLLLALFGGFQILACFSYLAYSADIASNQTVSLISDALLGGTEIASTAVLCLVFFPPSIYRRWINGRSATPSIPVGEG